MIEGSVNANYEAVITLLLQGAAGQMREIDAVVDTGYNGYMTLPPMLIAELELPFQSEGQATLANGSVEFFDVYGVTALWDGQQRFVDAVEADTIPLIGMALMDSHSLRLDVVDGGRVIIQAME